MQFVIGFCDILGYFYIFQPDVGRSLSVLSYVFVGGFAVKLGFLMLKRGGNPSASCLGTSPYIGEARQADVGRQDNLAARLSVLSYVFIGCFAVKRRASGH